MPTLSKTRELLEAQFITGWGSKTPIKFDNVVFDDTGLNEFVEIKVINSLSTNPTLGSGTTKRKRHIGVFSVKVFTQQNVGTGAAYDYADDVGAIMDNFETTNLFTYASEARRAGEVEGGYFVIIVDVPYVSDEV